MHEIYEELSIRQQGEAANVICNEFPTLRDQFAMSVLNGLLSRNPGCYNSSETVVKSAYEYADIILKIREEKTND